MRIRNMKVLALIFLGVLAPAAQAGLIGTTVGSVLTTQATGGWDGSSTALVGPGVEFSRNFSSGLWLLSLDVADTSFTLHYVNNIPDTGQGAANAGLLSVNLTGLSGVTNVLLANSNFGSGLGVVNFTANSITVPITSLIPPGGTDWSATWNITFAPAAGVPEPSSLFLSFFTGLGLCLWRLRSARTH